MLQFQAISNTAPEFYITCFWIWHTCVSSIRLEPFHQDYRKNFFSKVLMRSLASKANLMECWILAARDPLCIFPHISNLLPNVLEFLNSLFKTFVSLVLFANNFPFLQLHRFIQSYIYSAVAWIHLDPNFQFNDVIIF